MDTGLQLGSHWQLVAWHNCLSYFSYYSPINTAKNPFFARASELTHIQHRILHEPGPVWSHPSCAGLLALVPAPGLSRWEQRWELCWAHFSFLTWNLQMRPHSEIVPKHLLKEKDCSKMSNRALKKTSIVTRNFILLSLLLIPTPFLSVTCSAAENRSAFCFLACLSAPAIQSILSGVL